MGHERVGELPRSARWVDLIEELSSATISTEKATDIAARTLENIRRRYQNTMYDDGVKAAFLFLVALAVFSTRSDPARELASIGIGIDDDPTPLDAAKAVHRFVEMNQDSLEYGRIAKYAAGDALVKWHRMKSPIQSPLFNLPSRPFEVWQEAADGPGFCELARLFFASFTERYLNYFLEREASEQLNSIESRRQFEGNINDAIDEISKHAFETSKITQSFAAGWFHKRAIDRVPSEQEIQDFLRLAFQKMAEELSRESIGD